jgi:O-antigen ligase
MSPDVGSFTFTPKLAVLLLVLAVGLPNLIQLAGVSPHAKAARAGIAFLLVGLASSLLSRSITVGIFGLYTWGTGWLFWCGAFAAWAIGVRLTAPGRRLLIAALLTGTALDALVAVAQVVIRPGNLAIALYQGTQADGLMGNPTNLESLLLGTLAISGVLLCQSARERSHRVGLLVLTALLSVALELTGERLAIALLALLLAFAMIRFRSIGAILFVLVSSASYGAAYLASSTLLRSRLTALTVVTSNPRVTMWHVAARFLLHHPLLGSGPGEFESAITSFESLSLARRLAVGTFFTDGHDLFIQVGVTTGLVGLGCFVTFVVFASRRVAGPLLGFALLALAVELLEPLNIAVTPLALLALGAAGTAATSEARPGLGEHLRLAAQSIAAIAAIAAAVTMLVGDFFVEQGLTNYNYAQATTGARLLPVWYDPAADAARVATNLGDRSSSAGPTTTSDLWYRRSLSWRNIAVSRNPSNPEPWIALGDGELDLNNRAAAGEDFRRAIQQDGRAADALTALGELDLRLNYPASARPLLELALESHPGYQPAIVAMRRLARSS